MCPVNWPWAIILCRFSDRPDEPQPPEYYRDLFTRNGAGGAAGNGIVIVHSDPALCEFGFICHEMGHGFGLPHTYSADPDTEYGDGWDVMSFATTTLQFPISFRGSSGGVRDHLPDGQHPGRRIPDHACGLRLPRRLTAHGMTVRQSLVVGRITEVGGR